MNKLFLRIYAGIVLALLLAHGFTNFLLNYDPQAGNKVFDDSFYFSLLIILLIVGIAVYYIAHPIEKKLKELEKTASQLAHGKLNVRAKVAGNDAVSQLAETINYMADRIEALIRSQQELTNAISHELRTPIARICFGIEMVSMSTSHDDQEEQIKSIDEDLKELDQLIDELLTYARLGAGAPTMEYSNVPIKILIKKQCDNFKKVHPSMEIECRVKHDGMVRGEKNYLQRLIQNLTGNACRYANHKVFVHFKQTNNTNILTVEDDGPGIPEDDREKVFSPFARLDNSRTRKTGGYGLGLAIVRRIVRWHRGNIIISDSALGGAKMVFTWPADLTEVAGDYPEI